MRNLLVGSFISGLAALSISNPRALAANTYTDAAPSVVLDVPLILQNPELNRGCEVTSLAMMLQYAGYRVDKMTLASRIDKVPYQADGLYGNPNDGFVGDMYTFDNPGYGVYHAPVARLAGDYLPNEILDLTGIAFDALLANHVAQGRPVWVVTNAQFHALDASEFETWHTKDGDVQITWHEHSVVVTGFDAASVYINDPLDGARGKNKKLNRASFRAAWEQMGKQAITYYP